ncbi:MAG: hypothetical protein WBD31_05205 [Rubripirellula sp.]
MTKRCGAERVGFWFDRIGVLGVLGGRRDAVATDFDANIRLIARTNRSILTMRFRSHRGDEALAGSDETSNVDEHRKIPAGTIDVWWRGMENGASDDAAGAPFES